MIDTSENITPAPAETEQAPEKSALREQPDDSLVETFAQLKSLQKESVPSLEAMANDIALRLGVDAEQRKVAESEVQFSLRAANWVEKRTALREKLQSAVSRALLPVVTALTITATPALGQETRTDRPMTTPESLVATSEKRELKNGEVFDLHSPLAIAGEKMKALKGRLRYELTDEELAFALDFQRKAWQEKNEWGMVSGQDKDGKFLVATAEGEAHRVRLPFELSLQIKNRLLLTHTHPVELEPNSQAKESMHRGEQQSFVAPPSAIDIIISCQTKTMNQVVDPRGVWEYTCEEEMIKKFQEPQMQLKAGIENIILSNALSEDDRARLLAAFRGISRSPGEYRDEYFEDLALKNFQNIVNASVAQKYPGLEQGVASLIEVYTLQRNVMTENLMDHESWNSWIRRNAASYSDEELAVRIQNLIKNAEDKGVAMSYTPFKTRVEKRGLKQE